MELFCPNDVVDQSQELFTCDAHHADEIVATTSSDPSPFTSDALSLNFFSYGGIRTLEDLNKAVAELSVHPTVAQRDAGLIALGLLGWIPDAAIATLDIAIEYTHSGHVNAKWPDGFYSEGLAFLAALCNHHGFIKLLMEDFLHAIVWGGAVYCALHDCKCCVAWSYVLTSKMIKSADVLHYIDCGIISCRARICMSTSQLNSAIFVEATTLYHTIFKPMLLNVSCPLHTTKFNQ